VIPAYLDTLSAALSFDRALAQRVRQEVEDHLQQAVTADPSGDGIAAERRAIAAFGEPEALAAQFAAISVAEQMRKLGRALVLVIASVFIAMKGRVAWYAIAGGGVGHDQTALTAIIGSIDRYAFWLSVLIGACSVAYVISRPTPSPADGRYRKQLRRILVLCLAAITALVLSVVSDGALTTIGLTRADFGARSLVPIGTMAIEIACVGILVFQFWIMKRRTFFTAALHSR
jgi:hypothetical protein